MCHCNRRLLYTARQTEGGEGSSCGVLLFLSLSLSLSLSLPGIVPFNEGKRKEGRKEAVSGDDPAATV